MRIESLNIQNVRFNPEEGAFEALVGLTESGQSYSYPVQVKAPLNAEYGFVTKRLANRAKAMHRHAPVRRMRLRRASVPAEVSPRPDLARDGALALRHIGVGLAA